MRESQNFIGREHRTDGHAGLSEIHGPAASESFALPLHNQIRRPRPEEALVTAVSYDPVVPVGQVPSWLIGLLEACPTPRGGTAADAWTRSAEHWISCWQAMTRRPVPPLDETLARFTATMRGEGDLSEMQIEQVRHAVRPGRDGITAGVGEALERFAWRIRPWIPLWVSFAHWTVRWCMRRQRTHLLFLARDMLTVYLTALRLDRQFTTGIDIRLAHASRADHGNLPEVLGLSSGERYEPERVALVDSGCYGTVVSRMAEQVSMAADSDEEEAACVFYFSRNPKIFGFLNCLLSPSILETDVFGADVADFVIYAGDLLEAMPKPYRVVRRDSALITEPQDPLTFCLAMAVLKEVDDYVRAGPLPSIPQAQRRALELYTAYAHAHDNRVVGDSLLFHTPAPQQLPASNGFEELDFHSFPPQNEIFGSNPGRRRGSS